MSGLIKSTFFGVSVSLDIPSQTRLIMAEQLFGNKISLTTLDKKSDIAVDKELR